MKLTLSLITLNFFFFVSAVLAQELPPIKPGLWEVVSTSSSGTRKVSFCVDENTMGEMLDLAKNGMGGMCQAPRIEKSDNIYRSTVNCKILGSSMKAESTIEGDYSKEYTSKTRTTFSPPLMGVSSEESNEVSSFQGACPDGMQAGDVKAEDGQIINARKMLENIPNTAKVMEAMQGIQMPAPEELNQLMQQLQQKLKGQKAQ